MAYRFYITDILYYQAQNKTLGIRFADYLDSLEHPKPIKTGDEIAMDIIQGAGLKKGD